MLSTLHYHHAPSQWWDTLLACWSRWPPPFSMPHSQETCFLEYWQPYRSHMCSNWNYPEGFPWKWKLSNFKKSWAGEGAIMRLCWSSEPRRKRTIFPFFSSRCSESSYWLGFLWDDCNHLLLVSLSLTTLTLTHLTPSSRCTFMKCLSAIAFTCSKIFRV